MIESLRGTVFTSSNASSILIKCCIPIVCLADVGLSTCQDPVSMTLKKKKCIDGACMDKSYTPKTLWQQLHQIIKKRKNWDISQLKIKSKSKSINLSIPSGAWLHGYGQHTHQRQCRKHRKVHSGAGSEHCGPILLHHFHCYCCSGKPSALLLSSCASGLQDAPCKSYAFNVWG